MGIPERGQVEELFFLLSGEDSEDGRRAELCRKLCTESLSEVENLVKKTVGTGELERFSGTLASLAAAKAFHALLLLDEAQLPQSIASTEVRLEMGERCQKARELAEGYRRAASPVLRDESFCFCALR